MTSRTLCTVLLALASATATEAQSPVRRALAPPTSTQAGVAPVPCATDRSLGTLVSWEANPAVAFARARELGRLVLLLHLSGKFNSPALT